MRRISTGELSEREVINLCGGELLGYPCDFEIDLDGACIVSMTVPSKSSFSLFSKKEEYVIPWSRIECIGEDAILVKIPKSELSCFECGKGRRRK
jgi:YlmC/YmxH family sporulation protein